MSQNQYVALQIAIRGSSGAFSVVKLRLEAKQMVKDFLEGKLPNKIGKIDDHSPYGSHSWAVWTNDIAGMAIGELPNQPPQQQGNAWQGNWGSGVN